MTKHLSIQKVLATLLTIVAVFAGQQAFATIQNSIRMLGRTQNNRYFFAIESFGQMDQLVYEQGTSHTFNNATMAGVTLNGTLNFQEVTQMADVITATSFTVTLTNSSRWFYGATVQTKSGTNVTGCSTTVSSNMHTLTVTIPSGKTFGAIIVDYVDNSPMTNSNTTVTVPAGDYWVSNSSHKPQPEPTVVYGQTTLVKDTDYTLSWSNNSSAGTGTVTVTGIGNYAGTATGTFPIRWARYYVHFDKNHDDATGTMSDQQFTYNTAQALTDNTFSRTGYSFVGWSTTSNGAVTYTDGQSVSNLTAEDGNTVTLYAKWTPITYNIAYDLAGGSVTTANPTTYNIETATFTLNNPTRVLSTFAGWTGTGLEEPTMNVTIEQGSTGDRSYTATWTLIPVTYIDADGNQQTCTDFTIIESSENNVGLGTGGQDCWFVVSGNVNINGRLMLNGSSHLILCDGATLNIHHTNDIHGLYGYDLIIYGQSVGNGTLTASAPWAGIHTDSGLTINGGIISATSTTTNGISVGHDITINRGSVTAHGHYHGMSGRNVIINGGIVNATNGEGSDSYGINANLDITLGYTELTDRITASSYKSDDGTISVKAGQTLYDGTEAVYSGTLNSSQIDAIAGKTLQPCFILTLPEHVNATGVISQEGTTAYALAGAEITLTYGGTIPEGYRPLYSVNGNDIEGDTFQMPYDNATVTATITVNPLPEVTVTNNVQTICMDNQIQEMEIIYSNGTIESVTGLPENVNWSDTPSGATIFGAPAEYGTFNATVTVTSDQGCGTATADVTITVKPNPEVTVSNNFQTVCENSAITAMEITATHATIENVTGLPTGVSWSKDSSGATGTISGTPTASGTYNVTVTVNSDQTPSCGIAYAYVRITVNPLPEAYTLDITGYGDSDGGWNLIASPLAESIAATEVGNLVAETASDFDLYRFNQAANMEWENWKQEESEHYHFNLESGQGYLYANSGDVTLMFADTPYNGDGKVNLTYSTDNPNATMHGWNLIGNPFSTNATIGNTPFYRMNAAGSEIIAADVNDNTVNPMEGIFVKATQANQTVTFETAMTRGNANSNSAALVMDISQNRGGVIDRAIVRFGEGQTLPKFQIHENSTKIYIPQDGTDYAVAVIASDSEAIQPTEHPIHFKAAENGTYTLTISTTFNSQLSTVNYLHLIDNMTGADVDLLTSPNYTFTAKTTDYESRFKLVFAVGSSTGSDTFAFISNGNIIVNGEGTLQIFDAMGRQLFSKELSTFNSQLSTLNYTPGVYVLRLINGDDVRTQKIVVE